MNNIHDLPIGIYDNMMSQRKKESSKKSKRFNLNGVIYLTEFIEICKTYKCFEILSKHIKSLQIEEGKEYKRKNLDCITPSGVLKTRKEEKFDVFEFGENGGYTGYVFGDIDKLNGYDLDYIKSVLVSDPHIFMVKKSISGEGFHFLFQMNNGKKELYKNALLKKYDELYKKFNIDFDEKKLDTQVVNWNRLMGFSYDPNIYYDPTKQLFDVIGIKPTFKNHVEYVDIDTTNYNIIDYSSIDNDKKLYFFEYIKYKKISWSPGNRLKFQNVIKYILSETIKGLDPLNITLDELISLVDNYIDNEYTVEHNKGKVVHTLLKLGTNIQKNIKQKNEIDSFLKEGIEELKFEIGIKNIDYDFDITIYYDNYINDNKDETFEKIYNKLINNKNILVQAPTGGGKTFSLYQFVKQYNIKTDFIFPTRILTEQQSKFDTEIVLGKNKVEDVERLCCSSTWANLFKLKKRNSKLLIIDEAHMLITDYNFKQENIDYIKNAIKNYEYVIYLSGTPEPFQKLFNKKKIIFINNNENNTTCSFFKIDKDNREQDLIISLYKKDCLNVLYKNDIEELEIIKTIIEKEGKNIILLSSNEKQNSSYLEITKNEKLENCDFLFTTCIIREGVNIINEYDNINIIFGKNTDSVSIQQFAARFRKTKNTHINILHNFRDDNYFVNLETYNTTVETYLNNLDIVKKQIGLMNKHDKKCLNILKNKNYGAIIFDEKGNRKIDMITLLNYSWNVEKIRQYNNIEYLKQILPYTIIDSVMNNDIIVCKKFVKEITKTYNDNKKTNIISSALEILNCNDIFGVNETNFKYQSETQNRITQMREFLSDDIIQKNLEYCYCSASVFKKMIKHLRYENNLKIISEGKNFTDVEQYNYTLMLKNIGDELMNSTDWMRQDIELLFKKLGLINKGLDEIFGVKYRTKRVMENGKRYYVYNFTKSNLILKT